VSQTTYAMIPQRIVGPIHLISKEFEEHIQVPLATFETPLWPSVQRGARLCNAAGGIKVSIINEGMTRSVVVESPSVWLTQDVIVWLQTQEETMRSLVKTTSSYCQFQKWHHQVVGRLLYLRFSFFTADASGHNMATKAAEALLKWLLEKRQELSYVSISANLCTDKKAQAVNGLLGRGKYVVAEVFLSRALCQKFLKTTPEKIIDLNLKKNYIGSCLAGSIRSANAHFANMLLAFYLATGQDAANIVEGSQGLTHAECINDDLYFSVTLPNVIVGVHGNGKDLPFVRENLTMMGCATTSPHGTSSRKLAQIVGSVVLCGELSLLGAQTHLDELMRSHLAIERKYDQY
jgi:hydroxymethylglutaryl-CoA reductase (NADPH)